MPWAPFRIDAPLEEIYQKLRLFAKSSTQRSLWCKTCASITPLWRTTKECHALCNNCSDFIQL